MNTRSEYMGRYLRHKDWDNTSSYHNVHWIVYDVDHSFLKVRLSISEDYTSIIPYRSLKENRWYFYKGEEIRQEIKDLLK